MVTCLVEHDVFSTFDFFLDFWEAILDTEHDRIEMTFESFSECDDLLLVCKESLTQMIIHVVFILQVIDPVLFISRV